MKKLYIGKASPAPRREAQERTYPGAAAGPHKAPLDPHSCKAEALVEAPRERADVLLCLHVDMSKQPQLSINSGDYCT